MVSGTAILVAKNQIIPGFVKGAGLLGDESWLHHHVHRRSACNWWFPRQKPAAPF